MAFHAGTEEAMFVYLNTIREKCVGGSFATVEELLKSVDEYCYQRHWMMHIGETKAKFLLDAIQRVRHIKDPERQLIFLELGSYCGYSSVLIAAQLARRDAALKINSSLKSKLISIEPNPSCVIWTQKMAQLAGLTDYIEVIQTQVDNANFSTLINHVLMRMRDDNINVSEGGFDLLFIDHDKAKYLDDLVVLENMTIDGPRPSNATSSISTTAEEISMEEVGVNAPSQDEPNASSVQFQAPLLKSGCVVVADNVLSFNCPLHDYLRHVRNQTHAPARYSESNLFKATIEYSLPPQSIERDDDGDAQGQDDDIDGVEVSILI